MNFERHIDPKESMKIGKYANPKKVRGLKNQYDTEYKKLRFVKKQIYNIEAGGIVDSWIINDCYGQSILFVNSTFREYFEIYA